MTDSTPETTTSDKQNYGEFFQPNVQVTNRREIAVRGLTPTHLHRQVTVEVPMVGAISGEVHPLRGVLYRFEHFSAISSVSVSTLFGGVVTVDLPHLTPIVVID